MAKTTLTVQLAPEIAEKLDALARDTNRDEADIAREAITAYIDMNAWQVARIREALADAAKTPKVTQALILAARSAGVMASEGTAAPFSNP
jgi:predicted transcriptional regulator